VQYLPEGMLALLIMAAAVSLVRYHTKRKDEGIDWPAVLNALALVAIATILILNFLNVIGGVPALLLSTAVLGGTYALFSRKGR